jgi:phosphoglycolate phosphatase
LCETTNLLAAEVAMAGDSPADHHAGRAANCGLVVAVLARASEAGLLAPLANHVIPSIAELPAFLEASVNTN